MSDTSDSYDTSTYSTPVVETSSSTYDSTDWSAVAEVSEAYMDIYSADTTIANAHYEAATQAWLEGDTVAAYDLNQAYLSWSASADAAWDAGNTAWTTWETTTVTSYESVTDWATPTVDTSSYDASSYTSSYDTSSYDTSSYDTTSSYTTSSYDTPVDDGSSW